MKTLPKALDDQILFRPDEGQDQSQFQAVLALWNAKRGSRVMPNRGDIAARDMTGYLSTLQLLQVEKGGEDFLIRLIGTELTEALGYDPTGRLVSELTDPILRDRISAAASYVVQTRAPICTSDTARAVARVVYRRIEKIWLPLGSENGVTHILCQVMRIDRVRAAPYTI